MRRPVVFIAILVLAVALSVVLFVSPGGAILEPPPPPPCAPDVVHDYSFTDAADDGTENDSCVSQEDPLVPGMEFDSQSPPLSGQLDG